MKTNRRWLATGLMAVAALLLTACGSSSSSPASSPPSTSSAPVASGPGIKTASTSIGTVLTDSAGKTIYWFVPDTATKSNCNGTCATFWPPVKGPVSAASGVTLSGTFGTITRSDGSKQATYDGHPLYTYSGDSGPGKTTGNGLNASGGVWHAITPSGGMPAGGGAPSPSASKSAPGGYGY